MSEAWGIRVDPLVDNSSRWHSSHCGVVATSDFIGDALVARLRDAARASNRDEVRASVLAFWGRELVRRLVEYEREPRLLVQLASTGRVATVLVQTLRTSAELLPPLEVETSIETVENQGREVFEALKREREKRIEVFEALLSDEARLSTQVGGEKRQLELLTLMKNDVEIYGEVLTDREKDVIGELYTRLVQSSGFVVGTIPSWFATTTSLWPDATKSPMDEDDEERLLRQVSSWSQLRHPHVRRFYGACHVGTPFTIHEASSQILADDLSWEDLLGLALGLNYVHQQGFVLREFSWDTLLQLSSERKFVLSGMELIQIKAEREGELSISSNVHSFGIALLDVLGRARGAIGSMGRFPDQQPAFLNDLEWQLLSLMCSPAVRTISPVVHGIKHLMRFQGVGESTALAMLGTDISTRVVPDTGLTISDILNILDKSCDEDSNFCHVRNRLTDIYQQLIAQAEPVPLSLIEHFQWMLWDFVDGPLFDDTSSFGYSDLAVGDSALDLHSQIDSLMGQAPHLLESSGIHEWKPLLQSYQEATLAIWQRIEFPNERVGSISEYIQEESADDIDVLGTSIHHELLNREPSHKNAVAINFLRRDLEKHRAAYTSEPNLLIRWADTGGIVQILERTIESAVEILGIDLKVSWNESLRQERSDRVQFYKQLVTDRNRLMEEIGDHCQMRRLQTLLLHSLAKYDHVLSSNERSVTASMTELLVQNLDGAITFAPTWFATSETERSFTQRSSLIGDEKECVRQVELWEKLNHPNLRKFYGACHVGAEPYAIHEKSTQLSRADVLASGDVWRLLLNYAHGLHYLHSQGLAHTAFSTENLCVTWDKKNVLSGVGLIRCLDIKPLVCGQIVGSKDSDVLAFGVAAFQVLAMARITDKDGISHLDGNLGDIWLQIAKTAKPTPVTGKRSLSTAKSVAAEVADLMTENEWDLVVWMCAEEPQQRISMAKTIYLMEDLVGNGKLLSPGVGWCNASALSATQSDFSKYVYPSTAQTIKEMLDSVDGQCSVENSDNHSVYTRLLDIYAHFEAHVEVASSLIPPSLVRHFAMIVHGFISRVERRLDKTMGVSVSESAAFSVADRNFGVQRQLDVLLERSSFLKSKNPVHHWQTNGSSTKTEHQHHDQETPVWLIRSEQVQFGEPIARGAFGEAYWGKWLGTDVVIKRVLTNQSIADFHHQFRHEADLWFSLKHANLIKLYGACEEKNRPPVFVCEPAIHGTLASFLKGKPRDEIWGSLYSAAQGLQHLHNHGIVHNDLKGNNVLVCDNDLVKLADFGLSVIVGRAGYVNNAIGTGALRWKAPECLDKPTPSFASDIFSFGMCVVEVVTGDFPWRKSTSDQVVKKLVSAKQLPSQTDQFSSDEWDLVLRMCEFDPEKRISIGAVVCLLYQFYSGPDTFTVPVDSVLESERADKIMFSILEALRNRDGTYERPMVLPKWFIPGYQVSYRDTSGRFGRGTISTRNWLGINVVVKLQVPWEDKAYHFCRPVKIWFTLNHANVIQLYGACFVKRQFFVCEWATMGDLAEYLKGKDRDSKWQCLRDAARGLQYMHSRGIIHGELMGNSLFVCKNGVTKIGNVDLSVYAEPQGPHNGAKVNAVMHVRWKAPEVLQGETPTFAADIYSLGMCIIELITEEHPWGATLPDQAIRYHVVNEQRLPRRSTMLSDLEWDLVKRMCRFDPKSRIGIDAVVCYTEHFSTMEQQDKKNSRSKHPSSETFSSRPVTKSPSNTLSERLRMGTTMTVLQGLSKIYKLQESIRHQRRENRQTYLQLMEIYTELQLLESNGRLHDNATLRRHSTVEKFTRAVHNFLRYLQKYRDLSRVVRFFKRGEMEDQHQRIVAEIDQLIRMLSLAASVTLAEKRMNDEAEKELVDQKSVRACLAHIKKKEHAEQITTTKKEQALLTLIRNCVTSNSRVQVYQADGIGPFARLIRECGSFFTELNSDDNCEAIAREGAIRSLVGLVRSGTDMQRQEATYALGNPADDNDENRATISR
ncbi:Leucine-rich repeat serine/threonine-protein kinase 2 [Phytophthora pseudosyringae]|uniref:Leucine-rich repeat serine/threonine-protein kinase 2 n=1 Tax=Phytophthora pseudosyringae TaxID=221518 RepID=A0A8T1VZT9_9STRA|nr:Leucine-rich repeat serine/threonine-protein kinase 2 [Phytophthora pseudosyringae]